MVLLVLDGLGWNALREHAADMPELAAMAGGPITTVVPATTASALTSIATGLAPAQHGILGYRMLVERRRAERVALVGRRRRPAARSVRRAAPHRVPRPAGPGRHQVGVPHDRLHRKRTCAAGKFVGWHTTAALVEHCLRRGRGRRAARVRVLPGRRFDRARVRSARSRLAPRARGGRRDRRRAARRAARRARRCSSPPTTARCISNPSRGSQFPSSRR